jgi:hypothetical protein
MTKRLLTARTAFLSVCAVTLALGFVVPTGAGAQTSNNPIPGIDVIVRKCPPGNCMAICGQKTCNGKTQQPATSGRAAHQDYGPRPLDDGSNFRKGSGRGSGSTPQPAGRDGSMWVGGDFGAKTRGTAQPGNGQPSDGRKKSENQTTKGGLRHQGSDRPMEETTFVFQRKGSATSGQPSGGTAGQRDGNFYIPGTDSCGNGRKSC